jgi:hypothetical protein
LNRPLDTEGYATPAARAAWSLLLVALYLAAALAGWDRTLVEDEIWSAGQTERSWIRMLAYVRGDLVHPPLWYIVEKLWLGAVGHTDAATKTLPLLINVPALFLVTVLASRATPHWRLASLLFAALYFRVGAVPHLARMYGLLLLFALLAMLLWDRWRERPTGGRLAAWAVAAGAAAATHYLGVLLVAAFVAANWLAAPRRGTRRLLRAAAWALAPLVPWIAVSLPVYLERGLGPNLAWVEPSAFRTLRQLPFYFMSYIPSGGDPFLEARPRMAAEYWVALMIAAGVIHALLVVFAWRRLRELWRPEPADAAARWFRPAAALVAAPVALMFGFSVAVHPAMDARFLVGVLPAYWLVMVALGANGGRAGKLLLYAVILPWVLASAAVSIPDAAPSPVRAGLERAAAEWRAGDLVAADCRVGVGVWWEWVRRMGRAERIEIARCERRRWWVPEQEARAPETFALEGVARVWLFYADEAECQRIGRALAARGLRREQRDGALEFVEIWVRAGE